MGFSNAYVYLLRKCYCTSFKLQNCLYIVAQRGCILARWSLSDIHTLPPVPGTVRIPGEDALPAALIISAVSYWDLHQFGERGNIQLTLWKRDDKAGDKKEGLLISSRIFLV